MLDALPKRALFRFELPVHYRARLLRVDGDVSKWDRKHLLPPLIELEGTDPFADVYAGWNENGLMLAFDVPDRAGPLQVDTSEWWRKDGLRICVDTRDARDVKRATRFCHFFYVLPTGGGPRRDQPVVGLHRMSRAKEPPPQVNPALVQVGAHMRRRGYALEVLLPAACLSGWDPVEHPRIGLFYKIRDLVLGEQHLTVNDDLGWNVDPSTWATGVLVK